jgi:hypothetical protein
MGFENEEFGMIIFIIKKYIIWKRDIKTTQTLQTYKGTGKEMGNRGILGVRDNIIPLCMVSTGTLNVNILT